jgi:hypothetical protein
MAFTYYNPFADTAPYGESEEERRRREEEERQRALAAEAAPKPVTQTLKTDPVTGEQELTIKGSPEDLSAANPLTPTITPPEQPVPMPLPEAPPQTVKMAPGPVAAPVAPEPVVAPVAQPQPVAGPVAPQMPPPPVIGPPVQVAGPMVQPPPPVAAPAPVAPVPVTNAETLRGAMNQAGGTAAPLPQGVGNAETLRAAMNQAAGIANAPPSIGAVPTTPQGVTTQSFETRFEEASKDPRKLMDLHYDDSLSAEQKSLAGRAATDLMNQKIGQEKAKKDLADMDENTIAKVLKTKSEEGSWAKYLLLGFISPTLAAKEAAKLGLNDQWAASVVDGKSVLIKTRDGVPVEGYNAETNKALTAKELINAAAMGSSYGKTKPDVSTQDVEKDGMAGRVVTTYDARNRPTTMVESGGKMYPYDATWKSRSISAAATKDTFRTTLDLAKKFGTNVLEAEAQYEKDSGPFGTKSNPMTREEFRAQYNFSLSQTPGVSTGTAAPAPAAEAPTAPAPVAEGPVNPNARNTPLTRARAGGAPAPAPVVRPAAGPAPISGGGAPVVSAGPMPQRANYASDTQFKQAMENYNRQQDLNKQITAAGAEAEIQRKKELAVAEQKPSAEAKGKIEAKDINNQAFANSTYGLVKPIADLIKKSTGSGIGVGVDKLSSLIGSSNTGAEAIAELEVLTYPLISNVPRFEGPQGVRDVELYERAAGDLGNASKPIKVRLAALNAMVTMLKKYDKAGANDWTFGTTPATNSEKTIGGVTYVYDGKGWKKK